MAFATFLLVVGAAQHASAHFNLLYPAWRADSLANANYSQYVFPCRCLRLHPSLLAPANPFVEALESRPGLGATTGPIGPSMAAL